MPLCSATRPPAVGSEPDPADEDTRNTTNCSGFAFDKPCASTGARNSASSSLNPLIGLLPAADILDPFLSSAKYTPLTIFKIVVWSMMAGWLASKDQSMISSRATLPFALCAILEVELHPGTMSDSPTRAYNAALINLLPHEKVDIAGSPLPNGGADVPRL